MMVTLEIAYRFTTTSLFQQEMLTMMKQAPIAPKDLLVSRKMGLKSFSQLLSDVLTTGLCRQSGGSFALSAINCFLPYFLTWQKQVKQVK